MQCTWTTHVHCKEVPLRMLVGGGYDHITDNPEPKSMCIHLQPNEFNIIYVQRTSSSFGGHAHMQNTCTKEILQKGITRALLHMYMYLTSVYS